MTPTLTSEQLHDLFRFDEESGVLYWKSHPSIRHPNLAGIPAGFINSRGVLVVRIFARPTASTPSSGSSSPDRGPRRLLARSTSQISTTSTFPRSTFDRRSQNSKR
jgi:hypothetical protein